jgi:hypothetical protein
VDSISVLFPTLTECLRNVEELDNWFDVAYSSPDIPASFIDYTGRENAGYWTFSPDMYVTQAYLPYLSSVSPNVWNPLEGFIMKVNGGSFPTPKLFNVEGIGHENAFLVFGPELLPDDQLQSTYYLSISSSATIGRLVFNLENLSEFSLSPIVEISFRFNDTTTSQFFTSSGDAEIDVSDTWVTRENTSGQANILLSIASNYGAAPVTVVNDTQEFTWRFVPQIPPRKSVGLLFYLQLYTYSTSVGTGIGAPNTATYLNLGTLDAASMLDNLNDYDTDHFLNWYQQPPSQQLQNLQLPIGYSNFHEDTFTIDSLSGLVLTSMDTTFGAGPVFDYGFQTFINNQLLDTFELSSLEEGIFRSSMINIQNLNAALEYYFLPTRSVVRYRLSLRNPTASTVIANITTLSQMSSTETVSFAYSRSGSLDVTDTFSVYKVTTQSGIYFVGFSWFGLTGFPPNAVHLLTGAPEQIGWSYLLTFSPGETKELVFFTESFATTVTNCIFPEQLRTSECFQHISDKTLIHNWNYSPNQTISDTIITPSDSTWRVSNTLLASGLQVDSTPSFGLSDVTLPAGHSFELLAGFVFSINDQWWNVDSSDLILNLGGIEFKTPRVEIDQVLQTEYQLYFNPTFPSARILFTMHNSGCIPYIAKVKVLSNFIQGNFTFVRQPDAYEPSRDTSVISYRNELNERVTWYIWGGGGMRPLSFNYSSGVIEFDYNIFIPPGTTRSLLFALSLDSLVPNAYTQTLESLSVFHGVIDDLPDTLLDTIVNWNYIPTITMEELIDYPGGNASYWRVSNSEVSGFGFANVLQFGYVKYSGFIDNPVFLFDQALVVTVSQVLLQPYYIELEKSLVSFPMQVGGVQVGEEMYFFQEHGTLRLLVSISNVNSVFPINITLTTQTSSIISQTSSGDFTFDSSDGWVNMVSAGVAPLQTSATFVLGSPDFPAHYVSSENDKLIWNHQVSIPAGVTGYMLYFLQLSGLAPSSQFINSQFGSYSALVASGLLKDIPQCIVEQQLFLNWQDPNGFISVSSTPTPSISVSRSSSSTSTISVSPSASLSSTLSQTIHSTRTASGTPTTTNSLTPTVSSTPEPSSSTTPSFINSDSATRTPSTSASPTPTNTQTPSNTQTPGIGILPPVPSLPATPFPTRSPIEIIIPVSPVASVVQRTNTPVSSPSSAPCNDCDFVSQEGVQPTPSEPILLENEDGDPVATVTVPTDTSANLPPGYTMNIISVPGRIFGHCF